MKGVLAKTRPQLVATGDMVALAVIRLERSHKGTAFLPPGKRIHSSKPMTFRSCARRLPKAYSTRWPARQPISQKSASSRVASLKTAISSASRAGVA